MHTWHVPVNCIIDTTWRSRWVLGFTRQFGSVYRVLIWHLGFSRNKLSLTVRALAFSEFPNRLHSTKIEKKLIHCCHPVLGSKQIVLWAALGSQGAGCWCQALQRAWWWLESELTWSCVLRVHERQERGKRGGPIGWERGRRAAMRDGISWSYAYGVSLS
jgi:hypothetical protein